MFACHRTESKVLEVLNQASQRIASDLDAFWSVYMNMDPEGIGYIDISQAAHFFKGLFHVRVITFCFFICTFIIIYADIFLGCVGL